MKVRILRPSFSSLCVKYPSIQKQALDESWYLLLDEYIFSSFCFVVEYYCRSNVDTISVVECEPFNTVPFVDDTVDAICIFDCPRAILLTNLCMQARNALVRYLHIVS